MVEPFSARLKPEDGDSIDTELGADEPGHTPRIPLRNMYREDRMFKSPAIYPAADLDQSTWLYPRASESRFSVLERFGPDLDS